MYINNSSSIIVGHITQTFKPVSYHKPRFKTNQMNSKRKKPIRIQAKQIYANHTTLSKTINITPQKMCLVLFWHDKETNISKRRSPQD